MRRKQIEKMSQEEFFGGLRNEILECINSEITAEKPSFYFHFEETDQSIEQYKETLITARTKLNMFDFNQSPTSYILAITGLWEYLSDSNPVLESEYYRFVQNRFEHHARITGCIIRDNAVLTGFNYLNLIEPEITSPKLEKYMNETIGSLDYQNIVNESKIDTKEHSPLTHRFLLLELMILYLGSVSDNAEIKKIISASFNVSEQEASDTLSQVRKTLHETKTFINQLPITVFDFIKMKSEGIKVLISGIQHVATKAQSEHGANEEDIKHAKQFKKLCTRLESTDTSDKTDQINIAGITNYILENKWSDFVVTNRLLFDCLTEDFKYSITDKDEDKQEKLVVEEFKKIVNQFTSVDLQSLKQAILESAPTPQHFCNSSVSDDDAGPPDQKKGTDTAPPSPR